MPVSSPSEFFPAGGSPPTRVVGNISGPETGVRVFVTGSQAAQWTQGINDLYVIGDHALSAGTQFAQVNDANLSGSIIVGSNAASKLTGTLATGSYRGPSTVIGFDALQLCPLATTNTVIGASAAGVYTNEPFPSQPFQLNVVLGEQALNNVDHENFGFGNGIVQNVIIGVGACTPATVQKIDFVDNVIIGFGSGGTLAVGNGTGGGIQRSVVIGSQAGAHFQNLQSANRCSTSVYIGYTADDQGSPHSNIVIGSGATCSPGVNSPSFNIAIGSSDGGAGATAGTSQNIVLGCGATNAVANNRCILIGRGLGQAVGNPIPIRNDQLLIETVDTPPAGTRRTMLYGVMCDGASQGTGLVVGFSTEGTNRDIQGVNTLKLVNGVKGLANPIGGGYWYVTGGVLHWVDSAGVDTQLSLSAAGQLASSALVALTNNAGAAAGTLTNAPIAGNPTKWAPVNDNGTIRNVPLW